MYEQEKHTEQSKLRWRAAKNCMAVTMATVTMYIRFVLVYA